MFKNNYLLINKGERFLELKHKNKKQNANKKRRREKSAVSKT